jgi:hypothetical protein
VNGGSAWAHAVDKSLQNDRLKLRSVGRVLPLVFTLVDPWWTLRDVREANSPRAAEYVEVAVGPRRERVWVDLLKSARIAWQHGPALRRLVELLELLSGVEQALASVSTNGAVFGASLAGPLGTALDERAALENGGTRARSDARDRLGLLPLDECRALASR